MREYRPITPTLCLILYLIQVIAAKPLHEMSCSLGNCCAQVGAQVGDCCEETSDCGEHAVATNEPVHQCGHKHAHLHDDNAGQQPGSLHGFQLVAPSHDASHCWICQTLAQPQGEAFPPAATSNVETVCVTSFEEPALLASSYLAGFQVRGPPAISA